MTVRRQTIRRLALIGARTGVLLSAVALGLTFTGASWSGPPVASAAATKAGAVTVVGPPGPTSGQPITEGGSDVEFTFSLPAGAACAQDTASHEWLVQSYVVPATIDPASLQFDSNGPIPNGLGAAFRNPMYSPEGTPFLNAPTDVAATANGPGPIHTLGVWSFGVYSPTNIPAGTYNVGIACTKGVPSATQLDRYWNVQLEFVADASDDPAGVTWSVVDDSAPTSSSSTTTPTSTSSSTSSSTTGESITTTDGDSTTTPDLGAVDATTDSVDPTGGEPTAAPITEGVTSLPLTGSSTMARLVWAGLLILLGRAAVLLGRTPKVRT